VAQGASPRAGHPFIGSRREVRPPTRSFNGWRWVLFNPIGFEEEQRHCSG
jgi:hypothetical protein